MTSYCEWSVSVECVGVCVGCVEASVVCGSVSVDVSEIDVVSVVDVCAVVSSVSVDSVDCDSCVFPVGAAVCCYAKVGVWSVVGEVVPMTADLSASCVDTEAFECDSVSSVVG